MKQSELKIGEFYTSTDKNPKEYNRIIFYYTGGIVGQEPYHYLRSNGKGTYNFRTCGSAIHNFRLATDEEKQDLINKAREAGVILEQVENYSIF